MTSKRQAGAETRIQLIEAALSTLRQYGASHLTLDAVAKAGAVSKGGLLHHFPTKEALMEAILRQLFADYEQQVQRFYEQEPEGTGRWLRAYVRVNFADEDALPMDLLVMLFSAITEHPALMRIVQEDYEHWQERLLSDGLPPARVRAIRMAADAYWQERLIGMGASSAEERHALVSELMRWMEATN